MSFLNELFHKKKTPPLEDLPPAPQPPQENNNDDNSVATEENLANLPPIASEKQSSQLSSNDNKVDFQADTTRLDDQKTSTSKNEIEDTTQRNLQELKQPEPVQSQEQAEQTPSFKEEQEQPPQPHTPLHMHLPDELKGPETNEIYESQEKEKIEASPDASFQANTNPADSQAENTSSQVKHPPLHEDRNNFEQLPSFEEDANPKAIQEIPQTQQTITTPQLFQGDIYIEKKKYAHIIQESKEALVLFEQAVGKQTTPELEKDLLTKQYTKANVLFAKMQKQCLHTEGILSKHE